MLEHREITGNYIYPSCELPDTKDGGSCDFYHKTLCLKSQCFLYGTVTNP